MVGRLAIKVAIVTGASGGIGEVTARLFAREGARTVLAARSVEKGERIAAEIAAEDGDDQHARQGAHHPLGPCPALVGLRELHAVTAGRQLLLLQASDWPFVIHSQGAVDYGIERAAGHSTKFNRAALIAEHVAAGNELTEIQKAELAEMDLHDSIFREIDLNWWMP